jgi:hypothetical protein
MRTVSYCLAAGAFSLLGAVIAADAISAARAVPLTSVVTIDRAAKGDRLPAFAVKALGHDVGLTGQNDVSPHESTTTIARKPHTAVNSQDTKDNGRLRNDRDGEEVRNKKRNKLMDGCEASVSPLSPASASAAASRCVA